MLDNPQMTLQDMLLRNEGQVLTGELIAGILWGMQSDEVFTAGFGVVPGPYMPDHDDKLLFDCKEYVADWVAAEVEQSGEWGSYYAMGIEGPDGELSAGIVFNNFNGVNATVHIAVKRVSKLFIKLLRHASHYAFRVAGLKRLTGLVESGNEKALKLDEHMGFRREFVMKGAARDGQDMIVLVMWAEECPWLEGGEP